MRRKIFLLMLLLVLGLIILGIPQAFAQNSINEEIEVLKQRIKKLEEKMEAAQKERKEIKEARKEFEEIKEAFEHISIGGGITGVVQGTINNDNNPPEYDDVQDGSYSYDLELEVDLDEWGIAFMHLEGGDGNGVIDELGNALTGVNADALGEDENEAEVVEAWWQFSLLSEKLTFTIGKVDPVTLWDDNLVAKDETTQFMADIFVDQLCMEWPDYTPGFHMLISPIDLLDIRLGLLSADDDWEDLFEDVFGAGEIDTKLKFGDLRGNYRFYGWVNDTDHIRWDNHFKGARVRSKAYHDDMRNYGFGLSFDQQITSDIILFCRFGFQDDEVAGESYDLLAGEELEPFGVKSSWSIGGQVKGSWWNRPKDILGVAFGQAILSDDFEKYLRKEEKVHTGDESHLEIYYSLYLNDHLSISPDYQLITNLGGDDHAHTVNILGVRCQINF